MNIQAIKALLKSEAFKRKMSQAINNVFYNAFDVDHVTGKSGKPVLAVRIRHGVMVLRDSKGNDITAAYLTATGC
ncbi:hypothetical protein S144_4 [Shewanella sp. phage 1/44]|uniref:hypothetical protein n=1 Tax=Shewanella sp. phage 1/44 TaxID=1458862 RepID=UPI0004F7634A|nr:hypothetical protein S144_4 [Shewanella sp. phage 1/44]AHK11719.1 hypothetical protein S144_4 [Shewanella sp. phage 1/44]